jgi:hypothetical protein
VRTIRHRHAARGHADAHRERQGQGAACDLREDNQPHDVNDDDGTNDNANDDNANDDNTNDDNANDHNNDDGTNDHNNDNDTNDHNNDNDTNDHNDNVDKNDDNDNVDNTNDDNDNVDKNDDNDNVDNVYFDKDVDVAPFGGSDGQFGHDDRFDGSDEIVNAPAPQTSRALKTRAPRIEISWGELVDRYTIVELKLRHAKEQDHTAPLKAEFASLQREMDRFLDSIPGAAAFYKKMNLINSQLWRLENKVRALIRAGDRGDAYIKTALSITLTNEKRSALKVAINKVATTGIEEVKIYQLGGPRQVGNVPACIRRTPEHEW